MRESDSMRYHPLLVLIAFLSIGSALADENIGEWPRFWTKFMFIDEDAFKTNELRIHDFTLLSVGAGSNSEGHANLRLNTYGFGCGHRFIDIYSDLKVFGMYNNRIEFIGPVMTAGILRLIKLNNQSHPSDESREVLPYLIAVATLLQNPEIRIFPIYPLQGSIGLHYDAVLFHDRVRPLAEYSLGCGIQTQLIRLKGKYSIPIIGPTRSPSIGMIMDIQVMGKF